MKDNIRPWLFLDQYRGKEFEGEWPTIAQLFHISAQRNPDRLCWSQFGSDAISVTYSEAEKKIKALASYLKKQGITSDSHVAVSGKNSVQWAIAFVGVLYAGAIVVPMDCAYSAEEVEKLVSFGDVDFIIGDSSRINCAKNLSIGKLNTEDVMNLPEEECDIILESAGQKVAAILFTSGTTGNPKGVMLTNDNLVSDCFNAQSSMNIYNTDVFYAVLPIHHAYTLQAIFLESFSVGAHLVMGQKMAFNKILSDMKQAHVTMFLAVPLIFNKIIQALMDGVKKKGAFSYFLVKTMMAISGFFRDVFHINFGKRLFKELLDKIAFEDVRICISGGGPLPLSTIKMFHQLGIDFVQGYGMTETSPITHLDPIYAFVADSVGMPIANVEQRIVNPDKDGNGLIYIRGPIVMKGYYKNPEATEEIINSDGWLNTGDIGHIDKNGYLYLTGRQKNIIVSDGGKNIFPEEIEDMFQLYSELEQVCIIPYEIEKGAKNEGIRLLALPSEQLKNEKTDEEIQTRIEEIVSEVNRKMQPYKRITKITVLDSALETTSSKKIKRAEVLKRFYK